MKIIITESQYNKYKHLFEQSVYDDEGLIVMTVTVMRNTILKKV